MIKKTKYFSAIFAVVLLVGFPASALSGLNETYQYNINEESVAAPDAYIAGEVYTGYALGTGNFRNPSDLFVDDENRVYIADTDNNRVVILSSKFQVLRIINDVLSDEEPNSLNQPKGVALGADSLIYIADTGNERVIAINNENQIMRVIKNQELFGVNSNIDFKPEKVAVDVDGNVYVVDKNIYQGLIQYDKNDRFIGYFSPNKSKTTAQAVLLNLWKKLFNNSRSDAMAKTLPSPYNNLYIDSENFVYTCAYDVTPGSELQRLNTDGFNILRDADKINQFGDLETVIQDNQEIKSNFIDIHADQNGLICAANENTGQIYFYTQNTELLAIAGGNGTRKGYFLKISAIEKMGESYLVLDSEKGSITLMEPTFYMQEILTALSYYSDGRYVDSIELWENILKQNSGFILGYRSIGRALLQQGQCKQALKMLRSGDDPYFYSIAFKEYRKEVVRQNFVWIVLGTGTAIVLLIFIIKKFRRWILK